MTAAFGQKQPYGVLIGYESTSVSGTTSRPAALCADSVADYSAGTKTRWDAAAGRLEAQWTTRRMCVCSKRGALRPATPELSSRRRFSGGGEITWRIPVSYVQIGSERRSLSDATQQWIAE